MNLAPRAYGPLLSALTFAAAVLASSAAAAAPSNPLPAGVDPAHVDLLRLTATEVRVSSTVKNGKILPAHLVDGDLSTAWNSLTGELYGAWIEVRAPAGASIKVVRLTPGFAGTGPKGERYFTMNPRIEKVVTKCDGVVHGVETLAVDRPELQALTFSGCKRVRLEVVAFQLGTKKSWREISVSELEVWGAPPPGWTAPKVPGRPIVLVGPSPREAAEAELDKRSLAEGDAPCATIEQDREDFERERQERDGPGPGEVDRNYPPACRELAVTIEADASSPWSAAEAWCETSDEIYGSAECFVSLQHRRYRATIQLLKTGASLDGAVSISAREVLTGGGPEGLVRFSAGGAEYLSVCRTSPYLSCSPLLPVAESTWRAAESFSKGALVLKPSSGKPDESALGAFRLVFSSFAVAEAR